MEHPETDRDDDMALTPPEDGGAVETAAATAEGLENLEEEESLVPGTEADGAAVAAAAPVVAAREEPGMAMVQGLGERPGRAAPRSLPPGTDPEDVVRKRLDEPPGRLGGTQVIFLKRAPEDAAIQLFSSRRQRDAQRGILTPYGAGLDYTAFLPAQFFVRFMGNRVFLLNESLHARRLQDTEDMIEGRRAALGVHHRELLGRVNAAREKLARAIDFCDHALGPEYRDKVRSGVLRQAWLTVEARQESGLERRVDDPYAERKENLLKTEILTPAAVEQGFVAFRPSGFFGRFLAELCFAFNDALRRFERRTSFYITKDYEDLDLVYLRVEECVRCIADEVNNVRGITRRKLA